MSPCVHIVGVLLLPVWAGMVNAAIASCDASTGCGEETSLLQIGVGAEQKKLGQLSDGAGMGSQEGRSTMLQYGDDMLRLMTKKYGNASSEINQSDAKLLRDIIVIINGTIYKALKDSHTEDDQEIQTAYQDFVGCNDTLRATENGDITNRRNVMKAARLNHSDCRVDASTNCDDSIDSLGALNTLIAEIADPPAVPAFPAVGNRTLTNVAKFFGEENLYVIWYLKYNGTFSDAHQQYESQKQQCKNSSDLCNGKQGTFEMRYDEFRFLYNGTCQLYTTCFNEKSEAYDKMQKRLKQPILDRKASFVAGETIVYKIECLLGDHDCVVPPINTDAYNLTFPTLPAEEDCDDSEVKHYHCSSEFRNAEYNNNGITRAAAGVGCT